AAEIVVEEILEPHAGDEEDAPFELLRVRFVLADAPAARAGLAQELTNEIGGAEAGRRLRCIEALEQRERELCERDGAWLRGVGDLLHVLEEPFEIQERGE